MLPLAPGLFSTTTRWPQMSPSRAPTIRAVASMPPPAASGQMMCTGRDGQRSARAITGLATAAAADKRNLRRPSQVLAFDIVAPGLWLSERVDKLPHILAERVVDRMGRLGEPARASLGDQHVVLEPHPELAIDADGRLVRERHAGPQQGAVALHEIRPFVHVEADAVAGAVRQAGRRVARSEARAIDDAARRRVDVLAAVAGFRRREACGLRLLLQIPHLALAPRGRAEHVRTRD